MPKAVVACACCIKGSKEAIPVLCPVLGSIPATLCASLIPACSPLVRPAMSLSNCGIRV